MSVTTNTLQLKTKAFIEYPLVNDACKAFGANHQEIIRSSKSLPPKYQDSQFASIACDPPAPL